VNIKLESLVSVIMPLYNCELYVKEAIESVLSQSFNNFELIIVDDHSTDNSMQVAKSIVDERIRIVDSSPHKGQAHQLNMALQHCRGTYIAIAHSDDINMHDRLKLQVEYLKAHLNISIVGTHMEYFYPNGDRKCVLMNTDSVFVTGDLLFYCTVNHPSVMIRKNVLLSKPYLYDQSYVPCEDYLLWVQLAMDRCIIGNVDYVGVAYRMHDNQISKTKAELTKEHDKQIQELLFTSVFPFLQLSDLHKFYPLFHISANSRITASYLKFIRSVRKQLGVNSKIDNNLWRSWLDERTIIALKSSANLSVGAGWYHLYMNPGHIFKLGFRKTLSILFKPLFKNGNN